MRFLSYFSRPWLNIAAPRIRCEDSDEGDDVERRQVKLVSVGSARDRLRDFQTDVMAPKRGGNWRDGGGQPRFFAGKEETPATIPSNEIESKSSSWSFKKMLLTRLEKEGLETQDLPKIGGIFLGCKYVTTLAFIGVGIRYRPILSLIQAQRDTVLRGTRRFPRKWQDKYFAVINN